MNIPYFRLKEKFYSRVKKERERKKKERRKERKVQDIEHKSKVFFPSSKAHTNNRGAIFLLSLSLFLNFFLKKLKEFV